MKKIQIQDVANGVVFFVKSIDVYGKVETTYELSEAKEFHNEEDANEVAKMIRKVSIGWIVSLVSVGSVNG